MKARMKPKGHNDDLEEDELREVIKEKVTSYMVN